MAPEIEVIAIPELPENLPTLFVGVFGPDVASLRQLLVAAGNEAAAEGPEPEVFDEALDAVVIEVQEELGLAPDGVVGPQTWYAILTRAIELETERELDPTPTTSTSTSTTTSTTSTTTSSPPAAKGGQSSAMEQFADVETVLVVGPATPGQVGEQTGLDTVLDPEGALLWQRPTERTVTVPAVLFALAVGLAPVALAGGLMAGFGALSRRRSSNSGAPPAVPDGRVAVELAPSARIERPLPSRLKAATSIDRAGFVGHDGRLFPVVRVGGSRPAFPGEEVILINGGPGVQEA
ncbi:MAG: hypothetical protein GY704_05775 [Phycisphaeraceae bacterium]|nr:hypothetical protein [Phycisphaeraceae bacterium]